MTRSKKNTRLLITGASGFIGHHFWEHVATCFPDWEVIVVDALSYAGNLARLYDIDDFPKQFAAGKVRFVRHDIRSPFTNTALLTEIGQVDYIVHFAAETHVDRSIEGPGIFVETNVLGTLHVLELARQMKNLKAFVQISTDEVYGPAKQGETHTEWDPMRPSNPYAASKVGADALVLAWVRTYGLRAFIVRTMNNIGERQDPEKFVPHTIRAMCMNKRVTIHGNRHVIGSRCWIHPRNFASGVMFLMLGHGTPGEIYHIAGEELTNLQVAEIIADELNVPLRYKLLDFHHCRPGHDLRYALDDRRIREMGWSEPIPFDDSFRKAIRWMVDPMNSKWLGLDKGAKS